MATARLTDLLPTNGFLLTYALSLFIPSLALTFAGAFLTLDRTRSFAPVGDAFQDKQRSISRFIAPFFRGGMGGILTGFIFGIHLATFLSLLVPSVTLSQPLKPAPFVSVWLLSSSVISIAAGRWRYFTFIASGLCGGASLALAIAVSIHPSLLTRIALVAVFASTLAILTPLPIARVQPILLRISSSAAGSLGLILSIALFFGTEPWSNVWERLWVHDDIRWGSAQEKGLSAGFFLFLASGASADWWLRFRFGENPDQKWDSYLAQYVANLPAEPNRAGVFRPLVSIWSKPHLKYPELKPNTPFETPREDVGHSCGGRDDKGIRTGNVHILTTKTRGNVKFRPLEEDLSDSETESGHIYKGDTLYANTRQCSAGAGPVTPTHSSTSTILENGVLSDVISEEDSYYVSPRTHLSTSSGPKSNSQNFFDYEADIAPDNKSGRHGPDHALRFSQSGTRSDELHPNHASTPPTPNDHIPCVGQAGTRQKISGGSLQIHGSAGWQAFWRDVTEKIQHKDIS